MPGIAQRGFKSRLAVGAGVALSDGVRFGHVNLEVSDLLQAGRFYDRFLPVLGFLRIPPSDPHWLGYRKGGTALWITVGRPKRVVRRAPHVPVDGVTDPISDHIAFQAPSAKRVAEIEAAFRRRGYEPVYATSKQATRGLGWYTSNAWNDPDNNVLEIYAVTSSPRSGRSRSPSTPAGGTPPAASRGAGGTKGRGRTARANVRRRTSARPRHAR